jgi:hypothetical protein
VFIVLVLIYHWRGCQVGLQCFSLATRDRYRRCFSETERLELTANPLNLFAGQAHQRQPRSTTPSGSSQRETHIFLLNRPRRFRVQNQLLTPPTAEGTWQISRRNPIHFVFACALWPTGKGKTVIDSRLDPCFSQSVGELR